MNLNNLLNIQSILNAMLLIMAFGIIILGYKYGLKSDNPIELVAEEFIEKETGMKIEPAAAIEKA